MIWYTTERKEKKNEKVRKKSLGKGFINHTAFTSTSVASKIHTHTHTRKSPDISATNVKIRNKCIRFLLQPIYVGLVNNLIRSV